MKSLALAHLVLAVIAGAPSAQSSLPPSSTPLDLSALRERWRGLDEDQKALYRERFAKFALMQTDERLRLQERAAEIKDQLLELREELPLDLESRLRALPSRTRDEIVRDFFCERQRFRGAHVRGQLPPEVVEALEAAPPTERPEVMRRFHEDMRRRATSRVLDSLQPEIELPEEEVARLQDLGGRERMRAVLELKRVQLRRRVEAHGPPPGMDEASWQELDQLPLEEFFRAWNDRRRAPREGGPWVPLVESHVTPRPFGGQGEHRARLLDRLVELARPSLEELIELAELTPRERRARAFERARERCEEFLETNPLLPPEEAARLAELSDQEFLAELRAHVGRQATDAWGRFARPGGFERGRGGVRGERRHGGPPSDIPPRASGASDGTSKPAGGVHGPSSPSRTSMATIQLSGARPEPPPRPGALLHRRCACHEVAPDLT